MKGGLMMSGKWIARKLALLRTKLWGNLRETRQITKALNQARQPAIWLRRNPKASGKSRLGGLPSLPPDMEWPRQTQANTPLHFLAQIDLSALPRTPFIPGGPELPLSGLLMFFVDMDDSLVWDDPSASTRVLYSPIIGPVRRAPADLPQIFHMFGKIDGSDSVGFGVYPAKRLEAFVIDTFGQQLHFGKPLSKAAEWRMIASIERATGSRVPQMTSKDRPRAIEQPAVIEVWRDRKEPSIRQHLVLGSPTDVQGTALRAKADGLVCLFQLDTDWGVHEHFMFCDVGMIQFWITPEDLRNRRFDKAWATTEGG